MTHFYAWVAVPMNSDHDFMKVQVDKALETFSEEYPKESYSTECSCDVLGRRERAFHMASLLCGDLYNSVSQALNCRKRDWLDDQAVDYRSWWTTFTDYYDYAPDGFSPECVACHGTGHYTITSNPDALYDWYAIGGRYEGLFPSQRNWAYGREIHGWTDHLPMPAFIVMGDRRVIRPRTEKTVSMTPLQWRNRVKAVVGTYRHLTFVIVDMHI